MSPPVQTEAFKFAQDLVKQIITLATGVLTITLTFLEKVSGASGPKTAGGWLTAAWIVLIVSILAGLLALMGLTGALASDKTTIRTLTQTVPAMVQVVAFGVGMVLVTIAVIAG